MGTLRVSLKTRLQLRPTLVMGIVDNLLPQERQGEDAGVCDALTLLVQQHHVEVLTGWFGSSGPRLIEEVGNTCGSALQQPAEVRLFWQQIIDPTDQRSTAVAVDCGESEVPLFAMQFTPPVFTLVFGRASKIKDKWEAV